MTGYIASLALAGVTLVVVLLLMRSRRIREKYAAIWIVIAILTVVVGLVPSLLTWTASQLGFEAPVNLLFFAAMLALLLISVQYSVELSTLEEEVRTLAEEVALLRLDVEDVRSDISVPSPVTHADDSSSRMS
ncbi:DUF2304 domain-containing protein [Cellulomonas sp. P22]|uniref:DUF2304 domain-containing protein n=1 Tax=Cellulomonas sp. P22 TaxID=3373189 RepID=UPI00378A4B86